MKIKFEHTGDVHSFVMAMMSGNPFTLTNGSKVMTVKPNTFTVSKVKGSPEVSEVQVTVSLPDLFSESEAKMTFQYITKSVILAKAVNPVEEVMHQDEVYGIPAYSHSEDFSIYPGSEGVTFVPNGTPKESGEIFLPGAKSYPGIAARPAIPGRPEVTVQLFCSRSASGLMVEFE